MFDKAFKRVNTFVDYKIELVKGSEKRVEDSTKRAGTKLEQKVAKKQKIDDAKVDDDQEEARMKELMNIVPDEEEVAIDAISLATKPLCIVDSLYKLSKIYSIGINTSDTEAPRMQKEEDLRGDDLKHYEAEIEAMNLILTSILDDIYNSVDACKTTKAMWQRVERLMRGTVQNKVNRETRFNNEFDQFIAKPGEALVSVYNHFAQPMNDLERNDIIFPNVTVNTKFLNCLQPEWLKVKKVEKSHDPFALVAHTGSYFRTTTPYYVTHPSSVLDYDEDYQGDAVQKNSENPLTFAMILLAQHNDFLFADASRMEEIKELSANICLMARIQPANFDSDAGPSYDYAFLNTKDILDDAAKSKIKMKNTMKDPIAIEKKQNLCTIDYKKLNALYEDFVPQRELSAKEKYFSSSFIYSKIFSNASSSYSSSETKPTVTPMPSAIQC
ncbi:hypothetical protein Tco_0044686 [Tanacetum coccineum]